MSIPYPAGASAASFPIGAPVRITVDQRALLPAIGTVYAINPKTNKVFVAWPTGGNTQHAPDELAIVPPEQGYSTVLAPAPGYRTWEVAKSEATYGALTPESLKKQASSIAVTASVDALKKQASSWKEAGVDFTLAHDAALSIYSGTVPSSAITAVVDSVYA